MNTCIEKEYIDFCFIKINFGGLDFNEKNCKAELENMK